MGESFYRTRHARSGLIVPNHSIQSQEEMAARGGGFLRSCWFFKNESSASHCVPCASVLQCGKKENRLETLTKSMLIYLDVGWEITPIFPIFLIVQRDIRGMCWSMYVWFCRSMNSNSALGGKVLFQPPPALSLSLSLFSLACSLSFMSPLNIQSSFWRV